METRWAKAVKYYQRPLLLLQQAYDPLAQFLDTAICLV